ncbi:MAG: M56 family metallopeptidase [Pirellula sp.]
MNVEILGGINLFGLAVRSMLPLIAVLPIAMFYRRASPARLHLIWFLGLCGCLILPLTSLVLPRWNFGVLPAKMTSEPVVTYPSLGSLETRLTPDSGSQSAVNQVRHNAQMNLTIDSPHPPVNSTAPTDIAAPVATSDQDVQAKSTPRFECPSNPTIPTLLTIAWLVGSLLLGLRLVLLNLAVDRLLSECDSNEDPGWQELLRGCCSQMQIRHEIRLVFHHREIPPMVFGWLRPVIFLPESSQQWSNDKRKLVVMHELAHVQRRDLATQMLAGLACALCWFNPLAWWASLEMRRLREIACDDLVVARTSQASQYAETLLSVAKSCRSPLVAGGIAMSRSSHVGHRIGCILDTARRRNPFSSRSVLLLACLTIGLSALAGALGLTTRAQEVKPAATEAKDDMKEVAIETEKTMTVRVLNENDQPLEAAEVEVSVWEIEGKKNYPHREFKTNENGDVRVPIPSKLNLMRIWSSMTGYVPQFLNFAEGKHGEGKDIPDTFTFRLQRGNRISGKVVDDSGNPIAGAKVEVSVQGIDPIWESNASPVVNGHLAYGEDAAVTNDQGIWEVTNAPGPIANKDYTFGLVVTHPDYLGDSQRDELKDAQGVTTEQLRSGTASLTLKKGIVLAGLITDAKGNPVTRGIVIWNERPYGASGVNEAEIDSTGRYKTIQLAPGKRKITVVAPGFAPQQPEVEISHGLQDVDFQLEKGHPLKIRITDAAGTPLPKAYAQIKEWRGTGALYSHVHPSVLTSGIPDRADENGLFAWDWAPADAVKFSIQAKGYSTQQIVLIAKEEPHEVRLAMPPTIFGSVVDSVTKKPIESFRVIPVKAFSPDFYSTDFQASHGVKGEHGVYRIQFDSDGQTGNRYRVRIEADGYRTAAGQKDLAVGDAPVQQNFQLEPKPAWVGTVEDSSGQPVTEFYVAVGTPTVASYFYLDRLDNHFGIAFEIKGKNRFELAATFEPSRIRVFNDKGFAEVLRQPDEPIGTIRLQPWASVSGRLMQGDTPMANEIMYFRPVVSRELTEARFQDSYFVKTDVDGYFRFDKLPPESGSVNAYLGPWQKSKLTSSESKPLQMEPGKTSEIVLGGSGATVHGRVIATGRKNDELNKNWSLNYLVRRNSGIPRPLNAAPLSFDPREPLSADWTSRPDFDSWLSSQQYHFAKLSEDGRLKIHGVEAGEYDLLIQLYEQPAGCLVETIGQKVIPLSISEAQVAKRDVELGDIEIPCRIGPRVGSDMRAFKFTDAKGVGKQVNDMQGQYVLFHVWATWCGPCMASMPNLKADIETFSKQPLTVVGFNIDDSTAQAEEIARKQEFSWAQNYLGPRSDLMRQLAVSSVPVYYLIGPDGKLVGSSNAWEDMKAILDVQIAK